MLIPDWQSLMINLSHLGASDLPISIVEKVIRPVAVYLLLVIALRAFGKRILAQLNPFDLVVLLTLSNTVQNAIIGNDTSLWGGVLGAAALLAVNAVLVRVYYRGPMMERVTDERDIDLIRSGQLQSADSVNCTSISASSPPKHMSEDSTTSAKWRAPSCIPMARST